MPKYAHIKNAFHACPNRKQKEETLQETTTTPPPPKNCKGQCLFLVETVEKNNIQKLEITPIVFNIPRLLGYKYAQLFVVVGEIHMKEAGKVRCCSCRCFLPTFYNNNNS
jgi:hypothetical protein